MKPGDLIEWVRGWDGERVDPGYELWSTTMGKWVPICEPALLVSIDEKTYSWLTPNGLYSAYVHNVVLGTNNGQTIAGQTTPRKVQS